MTKSSLSSTEKEMILAAVLALNRCRRFCCRRHRHLVLVDPCDLSTSHSDCLGRVSHGVGLKNIAAPLSAEIYPRRLASHSRSCQH